MRFVQIAAAASASEGMHDETLFALDEYGRIWERSYDLLAGTCKWRLIEPPSAEEARHAA